MIHLSCLVKIITRCSVLIRAENTNFKPSYFLVKHNQQLERKRMKKRKKKRNMITIKLKTIRYSKRGKLLEEKIVQNVV